MNNPIKYTNLTYGDMKSQIGSMIQSDPRFANFRDGDISQFILDMFSAVTDVTNYYLERRAEECYMDSARHRSSVIRIARMFGYDIRRPIPAKAKISFILAGNFVDGNGDCVFSAYDKIKIPSKTPFEYNGVKFLLKRPFIYTLTTEIISRMENETAEFSLHLSVDDSGLPIEVIQGSLKQKVFEGLTNIQNNQTFQIYKIDDTTFSNYYGEDDPIYGQITTVEVGTDLSKRSYQIDRRSLINWENIGMEIGDASKDICLIRTNVDDSVELTFGDDKFASIGAKSGENVYVTYLSTDGGSSNINGVVGKKINIVGDIYTTNNLAGIGSRLTFLFDTNVVGGLDVEDIESIRYGTPKMYYSLDRLVSKQDFKNYLKSFKEPIVVKNAVAWGEQEQMKYSSTSSIKKADVKSFNVAFFSVLGSLYNTTGNVYSMKKGRELEYSILDDIYINDYYMPTQSMFNVYSRGEIASQIKEYFCNNSDYTIEIRKCYEGKYFTTGKFNSLFVNGTKLTFSYSTAKSENDTSTSASTTITLSPKQFTSLDEVAQHIEDALSLVVDTRGSSEINSNYGSYAFQNVSVSIMYDPLFVTSDNNNVGKSTVSISFPYSSECYISNIEQNDLTTYLGVYDNNSVPVYEYRDVLNEDSAMDTYSANIKTVVADMATKCQITTVPLYVSPIFQTFKLAGNVYIKNMYDKEVVKTEVINSLYSWFDTNIDFNSDIYVYDVLNIIGDNVGVLNSNVSFVPKSHNYGTPYNVKSRFSKIVGLFSENTADVILGTFNKLLVSDLTDVDRDGDTETQSTQTYVYYEKDGHGVTTKKSITNTSTFNMPGMSEREFFYGWMSNIYNDIKTFIDDDTKSVYEVNCLAYDIFGLGVRPPISTDDDTIIDTYNRENTKLISSLNIEQYQFSKLFNSFISQARRLISYYIQIGMKDSSGNITNYSMPNEIVKIDLSELNFIYRD